MLDCSNTVVKSRFSVNAYVPELSQPLDFVKAFNSKTGAFRDLAAKGEKLKANEKYCIFVQLLCKDTSLLFSDTFVRINIF